jgi:ribosomal protein S4
MNKHKTRPKLKKYLQTNLFFSLKKHRTVRKKSRLRFFSPDFIYLTSKFSKKLEEEFKKTLLNKRKLKLFFGFQKTTLLKNFLDKVLFKKFNNSLKESLFCSLLERRLDVILYRLGFVKTLFEARHLISHKKVFINDFLIKSCSHILKKGDIISFTPSSKIFIKKRLLEELKVRNFFFATFDHIEINFQMLKIIVLAEKINLSRQIQHYSFLFDWKTI